MPTTTVTRRFRKKSTRARRSSKKRCTFTRRAMSKGGKTRCRNRAKLRSRRTARRRQNKHNIAAGWFPSGSLPYAKKEYATLGDDKPLFTFSANKGQNGSHDRENAKSRYFEVYCINGNALLFYWKNRNKTELAGYRDLQYISRTGFGGNSCLISFNRLNSDITNIRNLSLHLWDIPKDDYYRLEKICTSKGKCKSITGVTSKEEEEVLSQPVADVSQPEASESVAGAGTGASQGTSANATEFTDQLQRRLNAIK